MAGRDWPGIDVEPNQRTMTEPITISYRSLVHQKLDTALYASLMAAFGDRSLGLLIISDLPSKFQDLRKNCLLKASEFAVLPEEVKDKYVDPSSSYLFGWSCGKESFNGRPDVAKGSYYARPAVDVPQEATDDPSPYLRSNIWPTEEDCPGYRDAFQALATFMREVGILLAKALDGLVAQHLQRASADSFARLIEESNTSKARLLHYFALPGQSLSLRGSSVSSSNNLQEDDLCGWHLDHSLITALCPAIYLYHPSDQPSSSYPIPCPSTDAGLFIKPRGSQKSIRAVIPQDCMAFQTGEALQVMSEGRLQATPHCVMAGSSSGPASQSVVDALPEKSKASGQGTVTRETMAVFLQPPVDAVVRNCRTDVIRALYCTQIGPDGETFGQFTQRILEQNHKS